MSVGAGRGRRAAIRVAALAGLAGALLAAGLLTGCAAFGERLAPAAVGSLLGNGDAFASDDDPELVRIALPGALKLLETVLLERPEDPALLLAAARGYALYAWAFPEGDALAAEASDRSAATAARERAERLYLRARDYGLRALAVGRRRGCAVGLSSGRPAALAGCRRADVPALFWTGAAWSGALAASHGDPALVADLRTARGLLERAAELAPGYEGGAAVAALLPFDGLPAALGGSAEGARLRYAQASTLASGADAAIDLLYAQTVALPSGDRAGFELALHHALGVPLDAMPRRRLTNRVAQTRARLLLLRIDDLFLEAPAP